MSGTGREVERRFLVHAAHWAREAPDAVREKLVQVYLATGSDRTVRIRLNARGAVFTVKGSSEGAARTEIESAIDERAARAIIAERLYEGTVVEKTRHTITAGPLTWELDQFEGANAGLLIAEVEMKDGDARGVWDTQVDSQQPVWLGREITGDHRFSNSQLASRPFTTWPGPERDAVLREITTGTGDL